MYLNANVICTCQKVKFTCQIEKDVLVLCQANFTLLI